MSKAKVVVVSKINLSRNCGRAGREWQSELKTNIKVVKIREVVDTEEDEEGRRINKVEYFNLITEQYITLCIQALYIYYIKAKVALEEILSRYQ